MKQNAKQSFKSQHHDSIGLSVFNCGSQRCEAGHSWGPALRDHHLIHIVASGRGKLVLRDIEYNLSAGDGFYIPENEVVYYEADAAEPWQYYWVGFSGIDAQRLLTAAEFSADSPDFHLGDAAAAIALLKQLYRATGNTFADEIKMTGLLYQLFSLLVTDNDKAVGRAQNDSYVRSALKFIEHNYSSMISVADIAHSAGISRSHLYRIFVRELGTTPNEYLTRYRVDIARQLLSHHDVNVSEAAYSSGFSDPLYFSRVFKKIVGVAPSKYGK